MALIIKDRVKEGTTSTGTGSITLAGSSATFDAFNSYMTDGDTTYYSISHSATGVNEWEVGLGTWNTDNTLTRTTVLAGSAGTSAVDFSSGTKSIFMTYPSAIAAYTDGSGDLSSLIGLGNHTTTDLAEGSNLYFNTGRIDSHLSGGTGVTYNAGAISIGQAVATTSNVTFNTVTLSGDPVTALQAATKEYVDTIAAAGIHYHELVRVEAAANRPATYDNGTSGVGATLTNSGTQEVLVIDGVTVDVADRVLLQQQTNSAHNGIYTVTNVGSASTNWVLTRAVDADSYHVSDKDALGEGDAFFVKEGLVSAGDLYVMNTSGVITFGTTPITFTIIAETAIYSAGTGLTLTGTEFATAQDIAATASPTFVTVNANLLGNVTGNVTGNITGSSGSTTGNAATATKLATARTVQLSGDVTGSASFDGSANINIVATVGDDSHAHIISNVDGLQAALDAKVDDTQTITAGTGLTGGGTLGVNRTLALDTAYTDTRYVNAIGDTMTGALTATGFTGPLTGNASTATALQTARTIGGVSFNGSANINLPGVNTAGTQSTSGNAATATTAVTTSGNAGSATVLQTARTVDLSGAATGTATSFNGSANITIPVTSLNAPNLSGVVPNASISGSYTGMTNLTGSGTVDFAKFLGNAADTALLPSFSWTGDTNTGIYQPAADQMGFSTAGVLRLTLSTTALTSTLNIAAPTFSGNGASLTSLNGSNITTGTVAAARVATLNQNTTGSSGSTTGNAATATALQTARTINGVSFNGTANITVDDATKLPLAGGTMTGDIIYGTADRDHSQMGTYDSAKTQQIWSIGAAYRNSATGVNFGNLYGITYKHSTNTTGGTMAGGHQIIFANGGTAGAAIGMAGNIWTSGVSTAATFNATSVTSGGFQGIDADTITAPSFTWTSDLNTGMWHAAADQIGFTTAGVNRLTITNTALTSTGQVNALTFNATSTTSGGFQGIDADTITAPSFTWTSDLNTGMWHAGADAIGFTTAGVNRITINNSGISGAGAGLTGLNGSNISSGTVAAARVATLNQSTTGNAATATALQTARTINGVSFNGTANITVADATKLPLAGGTATGVIKLANASTEFGTPTTGSTLKLWGSTAGASSTLATSNGNLHIDAHTGSFATYLNYFRGTGGILFGNGAGAWVAHMDSSGSLTLNGTVAATSFSGDGSGLTGIATTKVWANFNGETGGTIRGSFNVASVTDMGVGRYRVNFSTSFANANYSGVSTAGANISDYPSQVDTLDHNSFQGASQTGNLPVFSVDHDDGVQDDCAYMYVNCIG